MKLKIISTGNSFGTRVVDQETGEDLEGITSVSWKVSVETGHSTATIELAFIPVEVEGEMLEAVKPHKESTIPGLAPRRGAGFPGRI